MESRRDWPARAIAALALLLGIRYLVGADVAGILDEVRQDRPDEPLWKGVHSVEPSATEAAVTFRDPADPALRRDGAVQVACHLYPGADLATERRRSRRRR